MARGSQDGHRREELYRHNGGGRKPQGQENRASASNAGSILPERGGTDGYVFADDHPTEAPLLTIEEETLFRAAYPLVVQMFLKEKQETEENKLKCKKTKPKSKASDDPDDVASLFSELSL
ncbi:hypothetical protein GDO86_010450 [Hymenochirus boettgeri]|uniref:Flap endonuclease GEN chromatin organization modifier domain-containing protein n=1 Tax=Hymenochirus boettgeri TaxID=247094 RepID=A0A8T2JTG9_9PIPI|nr:hypothetical protein GDO86_010450 [Hymenochirus boettgeri]